MVFTRKYLHLHKNHLNIMVCSSKSFLLAAESDVKNIMSLRRNKNMMSLASDGQQRPSQPQPTMADTGRNVPLAPHMRPCALHRQLCSIGEDLLSKWTQFFEG